MSTDTIARAIAATEPAATRAVNVTVTLSSGRPVGVIVPEDLTSREALDIVSFVSAGLGAELERQRQQARPVLHIARQPLPRA